MFHPTFNYLFQLSSSNSTLYHHSDNLPGTDVAIVKDSFSEAPHFTFSSYHLNDLTDPVEIWERGLFLWQLYKGANALDYNPNYPAGSLSGIRLTELIDQTNGNRQITPSNAYDLAPWPTFSDTVPKHRDGLPDPYKITQAINKTRDDDDVKKLIFQLGHSLDWVNLYSVLDTLENIGKARWDEVKAVAGVTDAQIKAFTGTANNFGILGINARHGERGWGTPKSTMDLPDAQFLILGLSNAYLQVYHNIGTTTKFGDYEAAKKLKAAKTAGSDFINEDF